MNEQPLYTPSHESLIRCQPEQLLTAYVERYNQDIEQLDNTLTALTLSEQKAEGYQRQAQEQLIQINELNELIETLKQENEQCRAAALQAERIANHSLAQGNDITQLKGQLKSLQADYAKLKNGDNPERLRKQIQRLKEKNSELTKKVDTTKKDNSALRKERDTAVRQTQDAIGKIKLLNQELERSTLLGIYHNGDDHLVVWPHTLTMKRDDGSIFEGMNLLYLHQSGRGAILSFDPEDGLGMGKAPKGGLKPKKATMEWANNWMFKVNEQQNGQVKDEDLVQVNYNQ